MKKQTVLVYTQNSVKSSTISSSCAPEQDITPNLKIYSGLIQLTKILHTINYSIGRQYYIFNEMMHHASEDFFGKICAFHNKIVSVIFKDYNLSNKGNTWVLLEGQELLEALLTESVS